MCVRYFKKKSATTILLFWTGLRQKINISVLFIETYIRRFNVPYDAVERCIDVKTTLRASRVYVCSAQIIYSRLLQNKKQAIKKLFHTEILKTFLNL